MKQTFKRIAAAFLSLAISLIGFTPTFAYNSPGTWITSSNQVSAAATTYYVVVPNPDVTVAAGGKIRLDFDDNITFPANGTLDGQIGEVNGDQVTVDWSNNADGTPNPIINTGTIAIGAGNVITIAFTTNDFSAGRMMPVVRINGITNPAAAGLSAALDMDWTDAADSVVANNTNTNTKVNFEQTANTQTITVLKQMNYVLKGDTNLTYSVAPGGTDTNTQSVQVKTNADSYKVKLSRAANWSVSGGANAATLPFTGWGETGTLGNGGVASGLSTGAQAGQERGFGVIIDNVANGANTDGPAHSWNADPTQQTTYAIPSTTGDEAVVMERTNVQVTNKNVTDETALNYNVAADWGTEAGTYAIDLTITVTPLY